MTTTETTTEIIERTITKNVYISSKESI